MSFIKQPKLLTDEELKERLFKCAYTSAEEFSDLLNEYVGREVICALMDSAVREKWAAYFKNAAK